MTLTESDSLLDLNPAHLDQAGKDALLAKALEQLTEHHWNRSPPYRRILESMGLEPPFRFVTPADVPAIPVGIFKEFELRSIPESDVLRVLRSSGTTGQTPSRIFLDRETAQLQTKALVRIFQGIIGNQRRPMLIIDHNAVVGDRRSYTARGAGVLGLSNFGRDHTYVLDEGMRLDRTGLESFLDRHQGQQILVFGFTFMIWKYLVQPLLEQGLTLPIQNGILIHSGGWKKLQDEAVDRLAFRDAITRATGIAHIHDFYGMVEQVGSVFVECAAGRLHPPSFADVIIRDVRTWQPLGVGETGVIQVVSTLPRSYPGHSLLTEDLGSLLAEDDCPCGQRGRAFHVLGRIPRAELRGCSDTHTATR